MGKGAQELRVTSIHQWFLHGPIPGRRSQAGSERLKRSEAVEVGCGVQLQVNLPLDSLAWKLRSPLFVEESSLPKVPFQVPCYFSQMGIGWMEEREGGQVTMWTSHRWHGPRYMFGDKSLTKRVSKHP